MEDAGNDQITLRPAQAEDVPMMADLINGYAAQKLMLPRSEEQLLRHLPTFVVATDHGRVVGCVGLARLSAELAEIRSLAVAAEAQGRGVGRALVSFILQAAREADITHVCALTLRPHFFEAIGFQVIDRWEISPKIWQECIYCSKFHHCDEIAVFLDLEETAPTHIPHHDQVVSMAVPVAWRRDFAMAMGK